jgi:hypothetical protein
MLTGVLHLTSKPNVLLSNTLLRSPFPPQPPPVWTLPALGRHPSFNLAKELGLDVYTILSLGADWTTVF